MQISSIRSPGISKRAPWGKKVPNGFWDDTSNHRKFFDWLGVKLNIKTYEDWYQLTKEDVHQKGGAGLLKIHYNNSVFKGE
jgi:hypothetical protein